MPLLGEFAALCTATLWAGGSLLFTRAGRRVGAFTLNHVRLTLALILLTLVLLATRGTAWAPEAEFRNVAILMLSGLVGLTLGDWGLFTAFVLVGPRVTTVLMTLAPPLTALIAIPMLGETLGFVATIGMAVTMLGVILVVRERQSGDIPRGHRVKGVVFGCLGSLGQGLGLVLSKMGMEEVVDPLPATAIRMVAGTAGIWVMALAMGRMGGISRLLRDPVARWATLGATVLGPVLGIWFSLVAVRHTEAGIAATLISVTPVAVIPLVILVDKEKVSVRAVVGAVVSVVGVAILFLR